MVTAGNRDNVTTDSEESHEKRSTRGKNNKKCGRSGSSSRSPPKLRRSTRSRKWVAPSGVPRLQTDDRVQVYLPPWTSGTVIFDYGDGSYNIQLDGQSALEAKTYDMKDPDYQLVIRKLDEETREAEHIPCMKCLDTGDAEKFLICEQFGCKNGCHIYCLEPPMSSVPEEAWYCPECNMHQQTKVTCQAGHALLPFVTRRWNGHSCVLCKLLAKKSTVMYGCGLCNEDICESCYQLESLEAEKALNEMSGNHSRTKRTKELSDFDKYSYNKREKRALVDIYCEMVWNSSASMVSPRKRKKARKRLKRNNWDLDNLYEVERSPMNSCWTYEIDVTR